MAPGFLQSGPYGARIHKDPPTPPHPLNLYPDDSGALTPMGRVDISVLRTSYSLHSRKGELVPFELLFFSVAFLSDVKEIIMPT